jgi:hypothetical protein
MYPYGLTENPFPSAPTPGDSDIVHLGGKRHKKAKSLVISCIKDMENKIQQEHGAMHFRLITVIQDVGSGKTHLALHLRSCSELSDKAMLSFTDLSQLLPRTINNFYRAMMKGFQKHQLDQLRHAILNHLRERAEQDGEKKCSKIFGYGFLDKLKGDGLEHKMRLVLENKISHDSKALNEVLAQRFSEVEIAMIQLIVGNKLGLSPPEVSSLEEMVSNVSALSRLNLTFLGRITVFEIDEFDSDRQSMDLMKAMINLHLPSTLLLLVLTPLAYEEIRNSNTSLYDRLEKANYRIDLAGSNTLDEICDIVLEYMTYGRSNNAADDSEQADLLRKIKILYDEFPDFRNIRSMVNVMYHAVEHAAENGSQTIDEKTLDQTIASIYPGLKLRENLMPVPISEFIKIAEESMSIEKIKSRVELAIRALLSCASDNGRATKAAILRKNGSRIDLAYDDFVGGKTGLECSIGEGNAGCVGIPVVHAPRDNRPKGSDKQGSNSSNENQEQSTTCVEIDRHKLVDLIYFSDKYNNNQVGKDDLERALALGESLNLY